MEFGKCQVKWNNCIPWTCVALVLWVPHRVFLAVFAARVHWWLIFGFRPIRAPDPLQQRRPRRADPSMYCHSGLFLPRYSTLHLSLLNFVRFMLALQPFNSILDSSRALSTAFGLPSLVSSASLIRVCFVASSRSWIQMLNRTCPLHVSCYWPTGRV